MKRFLRYMLYREMYRLIRSASTKQTRGSVDADKPLDQIGDRATSASPSPIDGETIESVGQLRAALQHMDAYDFEHFIADFWEGMGWTTEVSSASADKGVDVIARTHAPYPQTVLIQAKRYGPNTTVGSPEIQQYASLQHQYDGVDQVVVVTSNSFTGQGEELATRLNVKLIDGTTLAELLVQYDALDLVARYLPFVSLDAGASASEPDASTIAPPDSDAETSIDTSQPIPTTIWERGIIAGLIGWIMLLFGLSVLPGAIGGVLLVVVWFSLPIAVFADSRALDGIAEWPRYPSAYTVASVVPFLAVIPAGVYLWRRRSLAHERVDASASSDPPAPTPPRTDPSDEPSAGTDRAADTGSDDTRTIGYENRRYTCHVSCSPAGSWTLAYGHATDPTDARVFAYDDAGLNFTHTLQAPSHGTVANTGTAVIVDAVDPDDHGARALLYREGGSELLSYYLNGDVADVALTPDGGYAAIVTHAPDDTLYVFDGETGDRLVRHECADGTVRGVTFTTEDGEWVVAGLDEPNGAVNLVVSIDGQTIDDRREADRSTDETHDPNARLDELKSAYDAATTEPDRNDIALSIAETYLELAEVDPDRGDAHLTHAIEWYFELLPWYEAKAGAAEALRRMATYHSTAGDPASALRCLERVQSLEEEYHVSLMTEEDTALYDELADSQ